MSCAQAYPEAAEVMTDLGGLLLRPVGFKRLWEVCQEMGFLSTLRVWDFSGIHSSGGLEWRGRRDSSGDLRMTDEAVGSFGVLGWRGRRDSSGGLIIATLHLGLSRLGW